MARLRLTRRAFIRHVAAGALAGVLLSRVPIVRAVEPEQEQQTAPPLPWPYTKLDVEETRKLGHLGYYAFECAAGAFWAIAVQLREKIGHPWTLLPIPSREEVLEAVNGGGELHSAFFQFGYGGIVGWGTICGALNGSMLLINMVVPEKGDLDKIGKALLRWYEVTPFPSERMNQLATSGELYPTTLKSDKWLPQSVAHSTLCHVSVSRWCVASGYASGSKERSERCGRLTGDVAARTVELLNAYFDGRLEEVIAGLTLTPTTVTCRECHYKGKDYEAGQFARGYMECESCHTDMRPHAHEIFNLDASSGGSQTATGSGSVILKGFGAGAVVGAVLGAAAGASGARKRGEGEGDEQG